LVTERDSSNKVLFDSRSQPKGNGLQGKKVKSNLLDERFCIVEPYESAWLAPYDSKFHKIRPGVLRKVYPQSKKGRRKYIGALLELGDELKSVKEIARLVDKRQLADIRERADDALTQMLYRAHCGDKKAMSQYILVTRAAVASLQTLAQHQPLKVCADAETFSD
jgi:hypothetical protein